MRTLYLFALLSFSACVYATHSDDLTETLHTEASFLKSSILQESASPTLYTLIQQITSKAGIKMLKSILIFDTEYAQPAEFIPYLTYTLTIQSLASNVYFDFLGDLVISRDILTQFKYHELEGLLAAAAVAKSRYQFTKQVSSVVGVLATIFAIDCVHAMRNYPKVEFITPFDALTAPLGLLYAYVGRTIQRSSDISALEITDPNNVRDGLYALARLRNNYASCSTVERFFAAFNLERFYKKLSAVISDDNTVNARLENIESHSH